MCCFAIPSLATNRHRQFSGGQRITCNFNRVVQLSPSIIFKFATAAFSSVNQGVKINTRFFSCTPDRFEEAGKSGTSTKVCLLAYNKKLNNFIMGGWTEGDVKTIFLQGVIPLALGIGLCMLGCLYLFGILQRFFGGQVAPVTLGLGNQENNEDEEMTIEAAERAYGRIACEAQLFGLQQKERQAVLERIFADCCTHKESKDRHQCHHPQEQEEDGDVVDVNIDTRCACAICLRDYGMFNLAAAPCY